MDTVSTSDITSAALADRTIAMNPYASYSALREQSPVKFVILPGEINENVKEPLEAWAFLRFREVYDALRDPETFSSDHPLIGKVAPRFPLMNDDPPRQLYLRRLVNKTFAPMRIAAIQPWLTEVANQALDKVGSGPVEFMSAYASPLPMLVIARFLGVPGEMYPKLKYWVDGLLSVITMAPGERQTALAEMQSFFADLLAARRREPGDDLVSVLLQSQPGGEAMAEHELIYFCILLLFAGNDTTTNLLGNMFATLAQQPALWQMLRENRSLIGPCIEEALRHETPAQRLYRRAKRDVEISGKLIPQDSLVLLFCGAANRDPSAFPNPDEFRLDRDGRDHVAFGAGIHTCIGAPLARAEARTALHALLDRYPTIALGSPAAVRQTRNRSTLGYQSLPLILG